VVKKTISAVKKSEKQLAASGESGNIKRDENRRSKAASVNIAGNGGKWHAAAALAAKLCKWASDKRKWRRNGISRMAAKENQLGS
jgi:hypothetical protein